LSASAERAGVLPMFPLGSVLLPGAVLPLHVFEPRYRALVETVQSSADRTFGVVLIERGSEVGGGDARFDVGTRARLVQAIPSDDGRYAVVALGVERLRVSEWLPDDPYPRARVSSWPDEPDLTTDVDSHRGTGTDEIEQLLRRCLAVAVELGVAGRIDVDLPDDPREACWHAAAQAPLGPLDAQRLLSTPDLATRQQLLTTMLSDALPLLEAARSGEGLDGEP
jgi:Lon protease-like protein